MPQHGLGQDRRLPTVDFEILVASTTAAYDTGVVVAASRADAVGLLDVSCLVDVHRVVRAVRRLHALTDERFGLVLRAKLDDVERAVRDTVAAVELVLLTVESAAELAEFVQFWRPRARRIGVVVTCNRTLDAALQADVDLLVAKGNEAAGLVGEETTFIVVQHLLRTTTLPVYAWGGIGHQTAAGCHVAGAAGVVLDWQLSLLSESGLSSAMRRNVARMDGSETVTVRDSDGRFWRIYDRPGTGIRTELEQALERGGSTLRDRLLSDASGSSDDRIWLVGQDACWASVWADEAPTVGRAIEKLRDHVRSLSAECADRAPLTRNGPLAASHGTEFPVVQGPMTRVSDVPEFCESIAAGGGLPFLALALMSGDETRDVMTRTRELLGDRPWGVGLLGFVPLAVRESQLAVIADIRPPFAIIAGGRPDQAAGLEAKGISTYLHVPSPGMLEMFVKEGARRFIFEGRECGGHVGPRSSFVLWETMVRILATAELSPEEASRVHVLFAGGICDGVGGAIVSAMAQPLVARGMKVGVLLGTAYLFTEEAVATRAIVEQFQRVALGTDETVVIESGPGHAIRCAPNRFTSEFVELKLRLRHEGKSLEEAREQLELTQMGRLRIASKGIKRAADAPISAGRKLEQVSASEQLRDGMYMIGQIAKSCRQICTIRELHERLIDGTARRIEAHRERQCSRPAMVHTSSAPPPLNVAIVGMSCLLPGAHTPQEFWQNVLERRDLLEPIPAERFAADRWYSADRRQPDKIYANSGGFMRPIVFDPIKYGIPPASIKSIEPVQLLALDLVDRALSDAGYGGYKGDNPYRERTSVILGAGGGAGELSTKYVLRASLPQYFSKVDKSLLSELPEWTEDSFAGILMNVIAGRVANRFDLGGVNYTVDAACASSLAAVYLACRELSDGTSDMAIAGGCDTGQTPFGYLCFATAGALSPRGRSRPFDESADGIAISEGLAAIVLKRVEDAERDGDRIYAVIRAASGGSDGRNKGLTAPRIEGQVRTFRRAYEQARFAASTVGLFEAHGTGTAVGDATECQSLTHVLRDAQAARHNSAIGSVKSNIGHTKCTAGVAGLMKTALAVYHSVLPPTIHVEKLDPSGPLVDGPLFVNTDLSPWIRRPYPRRGAVSSFGFGGTNFHVVLEEYDRCAGERPQGVTRPIWPTELYLFTGSSKADLVKRLRRVASELKSALAADAHFAAADLALTLFEQANPRAGVRAAIVCEGPEPLVSRLEALAGILDEESTRSLPDGVYYVDQPLGDSGELTMLFPGQGSQFPNMVRDLAIDFAECRDAFSRADEVLGDAFEQSLSRFIFPVPAFEAEDKSRQFDALKATDVAQPALGASMLAILRLLQSLKIHPSAAAGHSYGELVALHAGGAFDEQALIRLSQSRGRAMADVAREHDGGDLGSMVAVNSDERTVRELVDRCGGCWVANLNGPRQTVISGSRPGLAQAVLRLEANGLTCVPLPVACAFHTSIMAPAKASFESVLADTAVRPPSIEVYANSTADRYASSVESVREVLAEQILNPVRFVEMIENMYAAGQRVFLEVGPNNVLTRLVDEILGDRPHIAIATQRRGEHGITSLLQSLAQLFIHGVRLDLERLFNSRASKPLNLKQLSGGSKPPPAHVWLVDGAHARPLNDTRAPSAPKWIAGPETNGAQPTPPSTPVVVSQRPNGRTSSIVQAEMAMDGSQSISPGDNTIVDRFRPADLVHLEPAVTADDHYESSGSLDDESYTQFQETMREFLRTQQIVLSRLFASGAPIDEPRGVNGHHESLASATPRIPPSARVAHDDLSLDRDAVHGVRSNGNHGQPAAAASAAPSAERATAAEAGNGHRLATVSRPAASVAGRDHTEPSAPKNGSHHAGRSLHETLVEIVSERTGYPPDMLQADVNLESELGIDSIKRVEIIGALRRSVLPTLAEPPAWFMERMSAAKSMQEILAGVEQLARGENSTADASTAADPIPQPPAAMAPEKLSELLRQIVSDRTGYPPEMLADDVNLESELGIDSIKRVEIIADFRRAAVPDVKEPPSWFMEKMSAAKSMQEIQHGVEELNRSLAINRPAPTQPAVADRPRAAAAPADVRPEPLIEIVAERTGYPPDMLGLDIQLEAELGIDSIKRVEIIAAFRRQLFPEMSEPPAWFMERMSAAKTMREILDGVLALANHVASPEPARSRGVPSSEGTLADAAQTSATEGMATEDDDVPRCLVEPIEAPIEFTGRVDLPDGVVLLTDGGGVAAMLARELVGARVEILAPKDFASREAATRALEAIRSRHGQIAGLIHLQGLQSAEDFFGIQPAQWAHYVHDEVKSALFLLQAMAPELAQGTFVACVTHGGGDFDPTGDDESAFPWRGGLAGLLKCAAKEWPNTQFRAVDLDRPGTDDLLQILMREWQAPGPVEVGYRQGRRLALRALRTDIDDSLLQRPSLDEQSVVLVTGGARGITAEIALELAQEVRPTFILLGRTELPAEPEDDVTAGIEDPNQLRKLLVNQARASGRNVAPRDIESQVQTLLAQRDIRRNLAAMAAAGSTVVYEPCNVRDARHLAEVVGRSERRFGPINAIIHGSGVIEDKFIVDKTSESFDRVVDTKTTPIISLMQLVDPRQLRLVMLFGSVAGFFGNPGQCDYASANEMLNRISRRLKQYSPARVVTMNWGPWSGAGMVTQEVARQFASRNIRLVSVQAGRRAAWREILSPHVPQAGVLIGAGPWVCEATVDTECPVGTCKR